MKLIKNLAPIAAAAALLAAPLASQAGLVVYLDDGNIADLVTISDNGGGDLNGGTGAIVFSTAYQGYTIVGSLATAVDNPLAMHLVANVTGSGGQKAISIFASYNGIQTPGSVVTVNGGGSGYGTTSWTAYTDATDKLYFQAGSAPVAGFSANGYLSASGSFAGPGTNPFAATLQASFDYSALADSGDGFRYTSSQDLNLHVPEPASIALVGLALVGLGATARRRKA